MPHATTVGPFTRSLWNTTTFDQLQDLFQENISWDEALVCFICFPSVIHSIERRWFSTQGTVPLGNLKVWSVNILLKCFNCCWQTTPFWCCCWLLNRRTSSYEQETYSVSSSMSFLWSPNSTLIAICNGVGWYVTTELMILPTIRNYSEFSNFGLIDESSCITVSLYTLMQGSDQCACCKIWNHTSIPWTSSLFACQFFYTFINKTILIIVHNSEIPGHVFSKHK